jgi:hypothetical protein
VAGWLAASAVRVAAEDQPAPSDGSSAQDRPARLWHLTPELHMSAFTNQAERGNLAVSFGWGLRGGHRWGDWGLYGQVEHSAWYATEFDRQVVSGVVNLAAGGERWFFDGFVRTAVAVGMSVLTFDTPLDAAGTVGVFFDLRPMGLRWQLTDTLRVVLDPLHLSVMAPAMGSPSLVRVLYRTTIGLEILP